MASTSSSKCYDVRIKLCSNIIICGPSQCGKTSLVKKILQFKNVMFDIVPKRIIWASNISSAPAGVDLKIDGVPDINIIKKHDLVVLDDLMSEVSKSSDASALFTKVSHHKEACIIFLTQNLFAPSRDGRTKSINSHYLIIFKNPRDALAIRTMAHQMNMPGLVNAFVDATKSLAHSYLLLDFHQCTPDEIRIRTNITPDKFPPIVYVMNGGDGGGGE